MTRAPVEARLRHLVRYVIKTRLDKLSQGLRRRNSVVGDVMEATLTLLLSFLILSLFLLFFDATLRTYKVCSLQAHMIQRT